MLNHLNLHFGGTQTYFSSVFQFICFFLNLQEQKKKGFLAPVTTHLSHSSPQHRMKYD